MGEFFIFVLKSMRKYATMFLNYIFGFGALFSQERECRMNLLYSEFKRKFSLSMYKNLKIKMGEMSFFKDFVNDGRGDLYPILAKSDDCIERVEGNRYSVSAGRVKRLFCQFFPFATYEVSFCGGEVGLCFGISPAEATISTAEGQIRFVCGEHAEVISAPSFSAGPGCMIVSCRPGAFDVYFKNNGKPEFLHTFYEKAFAESNDETVFSDGYVALLASGGAVISEVCSYIDNGVSIADIRPIKYENGEPISEQGRIWFTASIRIQEGSIQGVFSWVAGTMEFQLTGAVFYDVGDGKWRNYLAPIILYHREKKLWYVWVSSFEHEHVLAHGSFVGDPRFGVNVIDVQLMEKASENSDITAFIGFKGDEDPDLIYDEEKDRWLMAICRIMPNVKSYVYIFFESDDPFTNYRYIGRGKDGAETGGSFVRVDGEICFVCGNDFEKRSEYRIYSKDGMETAKFNYPDGGFRGWGTVIPVRLGSRKRYFWLTFDRHNGSSYNWSYGNLYCFEAK